MYIGFRRGIWTSNLFTISLIGRANVGKSTLFNRMMGQGLAMTDNIPGLTRDRREGICDIFDTPIRIVDTAGFQNLYSNPRKHTFKTLSRTQKKSTMPTELIEPIINQTKQALAKSHIALLLVDTRDGIKSEDIQLSKWVNQNIIFENNPQPHNEPTLEEREQIQKDIIQESQYKFGDVVKYDKRILAEKYGYLNIEKEQKIKEAGNPFHIEDYEGPRVILLANKSENGFIGNIYEDIYDLGLGDPIFISGEHGDGLPDLYSKLDSLIPLKFRSSYSERQKLRKARHEDLKCSLLEEIRSGGELSVNEVDEWIVEFVKLNEHAEYNSDYDSDNEVDPKITIKTPTNSSSEYYLNKPIFMSLIGRPNVGKSTLLNSLMKENRAIVSDIPGTTRDSIQVEWSIKGRKVILVDTAGIKRSTKIRSDLDNKLKGNVSKVISKSQVVCLLIDSLDAFTSQDMRIIREITDQGKPLIILASKWDLVDFKYRTRAEKWMKKQINTYTGEVVNPKLIFISGKTGYNTLHILDSVITLYNNWNRRANTGLLNKWLTDIKKIQLMPQEDGRHLGIRFITQIKIRPPTFYIYVNSSSLITPNFARFIQHSLGVEFGYDGIPVRVAWKDNKKLAAAGKLKLGTKSRGVMRKINVYQKKALNPTYKRRVSGARFLYKKDRTRDII